LILQDLYKQIAWPLYKLYGHAFEAFKLMVADDGAALIKRLEEERGPLTVFTPQVWCVFV
jgi:translation initiation factor 2 subunit 1